MPKITPKAIPIDGERFNLMIGEHDEECNMASRHEKQIYEGQSRRVAERRKSDRRKSVNIIKFLQYLAVIVITVAIVKYLKL